MVGHVRAEPIVVTEDRLLGSWLRFTVLQNAVK